MARVGKGLIKKLKLGLAGLAIAGFNYLNTPNSIAQTNGKYPTLIHKLIEFENEPLNGVKPCTSLEKNSLDTVIKRMKKYIPKKPASDLTKKEAQDLFLKMDSAMHGQICRLDGECYQTAYMYYAVGDFYNLPIKLVMAPQYKGEHHTFVRWDAKNDGHDPLSSKNPVNKGDFNWDSKSSVYLKTGFPLNDNDEYFIEEFFIPKETIKKGIYMKNMSEKEMLAFSHSMGAQFLAIQANNLQSETPEGRKTAEKIFDKVIKILDEAIKLDSLCMPAYDFKAYYLGKCIKNPNSDFEEAIKTVNQALKLNPKEPELWKLKGIIHHHHNYSHPSHYYYNLGGKKDSLYTETIKYYDKVSDLFEEHEKIELSKKDRPILGINYAKLYDLTNQELSFLSEKEFVYTDFGISFEYDKIIEKRKELNKKLKFYKEKMAENPSQHYFWQY